VRQLRHLCQDDKKALDAIDRATVGEAHRPVTNNNVITPPPPEKAVQGNTNTYALRKLRKDRPDLHERVLADEISPHAAALGEPSVSSVYAHRGDLSVLSVCVRRFVTPASRIEAAPPVPCILCGRASRMHRGASLCGPPRCCDRPPAPVRGKRGSRVGSGPVYAGSRIRVSEKRRSRQLGE